MGLTIGIGGIARLLGGGSTSGVTAYAYDTYSAMVSAVNAFGNGKLRVGYNIYIGTIGVPDMWVCEVLSTPVTYQYTNDEAVVELLKQGNLRVGYYRMSMLESEKVDISTKQDKTDNNLQTTSKQIVGAINEIRALVVDGNNISY